MNVGHRHPRNDEGFDASNEYAKQIESVIGELQKIASDTLAMARVDGGDAVELAYRIDAAARMIRHNPYAETYMFLNKLQNLCRDFGVGIEGGRLFELGASSPVRYYCDEKSMLRFRHTADVGKPSDEYLKDAGLVRKDVVAGAVNRVTDLFYQALGIANRPSATELYDKINEIIKKEFDGLISHHDNDKAERFDKMQTAHEKTSVSAAIGKVEQ